MDYLNDQQSFPTRSQASRHSPRVLRIKQLTHIVGLERSTIYDYLNPRSPRHDPTFPKQIKLGMSAVGWLEAEVNEWINSKRQMRSLVMGE